MKSLYLKLKILGYKYVVKYLLHTLPLWYTPKIMVLGYARHGKDTVTEILSTFGLKGTSSSALLAETVVFSALKKKFKYETAEECFADRHNKRVEWYEAIKKFAEKDLASIGELVFINNDIYCGLRDRRQLTASKKAGIIDTVFWVDAIKRHPKEPKTSCTVSPKDADYTIDNNGTLLELQYNTLKTFYRFLTEFHKKVKGKHITVEIDSPAYSPKLRIFNKKPTTFINNVTEKVKARNVYVYHRENGANDNF